MRLTVSPTASQPLTFRSTAERLSRVAARVGCLRWPDCRPASGPASSIGFIGRLVSRRDASDLQLASSFPVTPRMPSNAPLSIIPNSPALERVNTPYSRNKAASHLRLNKDHRRDT